MQWVGAQKVSLLAGPGMARVPSSLDITASRWVATLCTEQARPGASALPTWPQILQPVGAERGAQHGTQ